MAIRRNRATSGESCFSKNKTFAGAKKGVHRRCCPSEFFVLPKMSLQLFSFVKYLSSLTKTLSAAIYFFLSQSLDVGMWVYTIRCIILTWKTITLQYAKENFLDGCCQNTPHWDWKWAVWSAAGSRRWCSGTFTISATVYIKTFITVLPQWLEENSDSPSFSCLSPISQPASSYLHHIFSLLCVSWKYSNAIGTLFWDPFIYDNRSQFFHVFFFIFAFFFCSGLWVSFKFVSFFSISVPFWFSLFTLEDTFYSVFIYFYYTSIY